MTTNSTWANYDKVNHILTITCQICGNNFDWDPTSPVTVTPSYTSASALPDTTHLVTCPYMRAKDVPCLTDYSIIYNHSSKKVVMVSLAPKKLSDHVMMDMAKKWTENTLGVFDKRAEYLITTIAGLMAINFGIIIAFDITNLLVRLVPNFFLSLSVLFFAASYFPKTVTVYLDAPKTILEAYNESVQRKSLCQKFGFAIFFMGLLSIAVTSTISWKATPDPEVNSIILGGNLTLLPP
jgi:hypothetical protein